MSDDHDKDAISAYSKALLQTPNIDRLAKEGMMFKKAFAANAICAPPERVSKNFFRNEKPITGGKIKI